MFIFALVALAIASPIPSPQDQTEETLPDIMGSFSIIDQDGVVHNLGFSVGENGFKPISLEGMQITDVPDKPCPKDGCQFTIEEHNKEAKEQ